MFHLHSLTPWLIRRRLKRFEIGWLHVAESFTAAADNLLSQPFGRGVTTYFLLHLFLRANSFSHSVLWCFLFSPDFNILLSSTHLIADLFSITFICKLPYSFWTTRMTPLPSACYKVPHSFAETRTCPRQKQTMWLLRANQSHPRSPMNAEIQQTRC